MRRERSWPLVRALACLYPPLVVAVTLLTANHFWIDAAVALAVVAAAAGAVLVPRTVLVPRRQAYELGE